MASTNQGNSDEITPEAITASSPDVTAPARSATGNLPEALEPELRRIIDTAVARVAAIELEAIKEARELTQRSEQEGREALRFALDRAASLVASLELLATTVGGMAGALKVELDDAIVALRNVPEPQSALSRELSGQEPAAPEPVSSAPEPPTPEPPTPERPTPDRPTPEPQAATPAEERRSAEPRIKLTPLVRPVEAPGTAEEAAGVEPAEAEPEQELAMVAAPSKPAVKVAHKSQPPHSRKGRVRRFFTR